MLTDLDIVQSQIRERIKTLTDMAYYENKPMLLDNPDNDKVIAKINEITNNQLKAIEKLQKINSRLRKIEKQLIGL